MDSSFTITSLTFLLLLLVLLMHGGLKPVESQLSYGYYDQTCPNLRSILSSTLRASILVDPLAPPALLRLAFHDCQVNGCDASIMLESGPGFDSTELGAASNLGVKRLNLIDRVKSALEAACPNTVSCADIIALAGSEAVAITGGPRIEIPLGRLDGFGASMVSAQNQLPTATISVTDFLSLFNTYGMSAEEGVAIMGAHTLGVAHCSNFVNRLYPSQDPNLNVVLAARLRARCPRFLNLNNQFFLSLDSTRGRFDNQYFQDILQGMGVLSIDSQLSLDPRTSPIAARFANDLSSFFDSFSSAYIKLTSRAIRQGEVRLNCRMSN